MFLKTVIKIQVSHKENIEGDVKSLKKLSGYLLRIPNHIWTPRRMWKSICSYSSRSRYSSNCYYPRQSLPDIRLFATEISET